MVSVVFVQAAMYTSRMLCGFLPRNIFLRFYLKKKKKKSTCKNQTEQIENIIQCQGGQNVRTQECQSGFAPKAFLNA